MQIKSNNRRELLGYNPLASILFGLMIWRLYVGSQNAQS